ncbi:hypothetical protein O6H91_04G009200 [Diphasiastrum complanatum]|uniref:Uncharacterized protein n=1 Tax=Diphasiastrum complanatum TaxID=34168 RepID=A0ACC2DU62_DIPCM|nr:hypothetical protein O6H91_04G009200 [Diphasiastrum complanatum]
MSTKKYKNNHDLQTLWRQGNLGFIYSPKRKRFKMLFPWVHLIHQNKIQKMLLLCGWTWREKASSLACNSSSSSSIIIWVLPLHKLSTTGCYPTPPLHSIPSKLPVLMLAWP